jgi:MRG
VESKLSKEDANGRLLAARVVRIVKDCFDELAPMMMTQADVMVGKGSTSDAEQGPPSERYGCDFLLRFLLVLPSILRQSNVPLQEINDCTEIIRELVDWMTLEYPKLFKKKYHPPEESYVPPKQPKQTPPELSQRLRMLHEAAVAAAATSDPAVKIEDSEGSAGNNALIMKELLRPEDKANLSDFLVLVMDQAIPCRATESDLAKKYRRVNVGFPGFVCRHCMGTMGEGRYFFSTVESLTTASTVFEKHVGKCKSVPDEIKAAVVEAKTRHADQRKLMPVGAQQAYFNRLWDRLRSSQIAGVASGTYVLEGTAKKDVIDASETSSSEFLEFRDHIPLLDYIRSHAPWKSSPVLQEAMNQYYGCIDYGGRVFYTSCMPARFSSEWLLRKVGPRPKLSRKKRLLPG